MAAIGSDIALARRHAAIVQQSDASIKARFPNARDGLKSPAVGYFDSATDATAALAVRAALIGPAGTTLRRRWQVQVADLVQPDLSAGLPCWPPTTAVEEGR